MEPDRIDYSLIKPFLMMAKAGGAICNMRCDYCYYLEKEDLYKEGKSNSINMKMSDSVLEEYVKQYIESQSTPIVHFCWHGGESLIRPISFYRKALEYQRKYAQGRTIENSIQTNGLLVSEEWCKFFYQNNFLVGISLDGTKEQHDKYRITIAKQGSFHRVMRAIQLFQKHKVEFNVLATVNNFNAESPLEFYHFLKGIGVKYIQFTPIVERFSHDDNSISFHMEAPFIHSDKSKCEIGGNYTLAPYSVTPEQWGYFTTEIYDEWVRNDVGEIFIQLFDSTLANWMGVMPGVCTMAEECGSAGIMEFNGDVYSCDHFVYPRYKLGNIMDINLSVMMSSDEQIRFGKAKKTALTRQCKECKFLFACNGECPKNRFDYSSDGEVAHNYLCKGYYKFFSHVADTMDYMKQCLLNGQPPSNVMNWLKTNDM